MGLIERLAERLPKAMTDAELLDHLSHASELYIEIDEPDGFLSRETDAHPDGPWEVKRRIFGTKAYGCIGRFQTLRQALSAAIGLK